eukprot:TRINITY_DN31982_c0_g1_i1.p1 TRINITY_DN31982_c0_g1~~TRINITY_DN31982_c0_g1_i1.p1  ORF type:complete len:469 (+),score=127.03 TRINITY_DN31982_c0_g1_i1:60-1466(+)
MCSPPLQYADAEKAFVKNDPSTWPLVTPAEDLKFVDRYGKAAPARTIRVPLHRLRKPTKVEAPLSVMFARWGGKYRIGEDSDPADEGDGGWGMFGCPPSDWYIEAVVEQGLMVHPQLGKGPDGVPEGEVLGLFLGSKKDLATVTAQAAEVAAAQRAEKRASFWMLWPCDWEAEFDAKGFEGYVERRSLFQTMRACEAAGIRTAFPHPTDLYEFITSKSWMATLSPEVGSRLPGCVLVSREDIKANVKAAAQKAMADIEALRATSVFKAEGGPSKINKEGLRKGVVKIGWSWEARYVWFWNGQAQLADCLRHMIGLPGCLGEYCIVQEWVDFDFELRFFFFPSADWKPPARLEPKHFEYTAWGPSRGDSPGPFLKFSHQRCLATWGNDEEAMNSAHAQALEASQFLIAHLLSKHSEPVPMIRMDFMLKRIGPGKAQVAFGEYCEQGACCLKWEEGPPTVWRAALDYALR